MELLDFITVLSIFLDNAIEASLDSITKEVTIALISSDTKVVIVENTIAQESINT
ncbi:MAG: GHKL domain-containing protein, partial [Streptococcus sp.]